MSIEGRLRHRVTISRWTQGSPDDVGHKPQTFVDDATPTHALVQELGSRMGGGHEFAGPDLDQVAIADTIVFFPVDTLVDGRDRIIGVTPASIAGRTWKLIGLPRDAGGRGRHLEIDAQRIRA